MRGAIYKKGVVVVVPFPFSDLSQTKRRPALVIKDLHGDDIILCQITSQPIKDGYEIQINTSDFESGTLNKTSNVRPNRLFTLDRNIIKKSVGDLKSQTMDRIINKLVEIITS